VSGATIVYCGLVALLAEPLLRLAYGAGFADAATVTRIVALQYVIYSLSFGWGTATKAADRMRRLWAVRMVSVVVSVAAVVVLTRDQGTAGAAFAGVATACVYSVGVVLAFRSVRRAPTSGPTIGSTGAPRPRRR
jgi:O-antigen/teichoic acid export membrane protein